MTSQRNPIRIRIYSTVGRSSFLHLEDALGIGKIRLFAGSYERGKGITATAHHFLDAADARVLLQALARAEPDLDYREYKGSADGETDVVSRVLAIRARGDRVFVQLQNGPGRLTNAGTIQPVGRPTAVVTVPLTAYEGQRLALEALAYLQAWDAMRLAVHRDLISGYPPYPLTLPPLGRALGARVNESAGSQAGRPGMIAPIKESSQQTAIEMPPTSTQANSSDAGEVDVVSRPASINKELSGPDPASTPCTKVLHYQDGTHVDPDNESERKAFLQYRKDNGEDPAFLDALRSWYGQRSLSS